MSYKSISLEIVFPTDPKDWSSPLPKEWTRERKIITDRIAWIEPHSWGNLEGIAVYFHKATGATFWHFTTGNIFFNY